MIFSSGRTGMNTWEEPMRAFSPCCRMVHIRVQLHDRPCLAFPLTPEQFSEIEERCFELALSDSPGELDLPIPGGATLGVNFAEIVLLDFISGCPSDTECIEAVEIRSPVVSTVG